VARSAATAVGCSCALGGGSLPLAAAEWSIQPLFTFTADQDSNQTFSADSQPSHGATLLADFKFTHSLETTDIFLEPKITFYRYSEATLGNGTDEVLTAGLTHTGELFGLTLNALAEDVSTVTSDVLESAIVEGQTYRHVLQAGGTWTWNQRERWQLVVQGSDADVSYTGQQAPQLPGYRYPSGSVGERYLFSDRTSVTLSAFITKLLSDTPQNSSRQDGARIEYNYSLSELTSVDAWVDLSNRTVGNVTNHGTDESISLSHTLQRGSFAVSYLHALVPLGTGYLVEQQQATASALRNLSLYLDGDVSLEYLKNGETAVLLGLARQRYESAAAGLTWRTSEHWSVRAQLSAGRCALPFSDQMVSEWRAQVSLTWKPQALITSR
jgi:hypothetical protein